PAHSLLVCRQLAVRCTRHNDHGHIVMVQVCNDSVEIVCPERAVLTSCIPAWIKHKVIYYQLASSVKKFRQSLFPIWSRENILFINSLPRQIASLLTELVTQACKLFFFDQKLFASFDPILLETILWFFNVSVICFS